MFVQLGLSVSGAFEWFGKQETDEKSETWVTRIRDRYQVLAASEWSLILSGFNVLVITVNNKVPSKLILFFSLKEQKYVN